MKTMLRSLLLLAAILLLGSPTLSFEVLRPGEISLPEHIQTIAIVDRSKSTSGFLNFIEKGPFLAFEKRPDWFASLIMDGLKEQINASGRVQATQTNTMLKRDGRGTEFGPGLPENEVTAICRQFETDALICLELAEVYDGNNHIQVRSGYRLYEPGKKGWTDQFQVFTSVRNRQKITSPDGRTYRINSEDEAGAEACYQAGLAYGRRILPAWYPEERIYFSRSKGDRNISKGARLMEVNQWEPSIAPLVKAMETGHEKTRGRAAHNLAVVYEAMGQYGTALDHARMAWVTYQVDVSRDYILLLEERIDEIRQMKGL